MALSTSMSFAIKRNDYDSRLDAHFYQPRFRQLEADMLTQAHMVRPLKSFAQVVCGPFGSAIKTGDYLPTGVPLLRIGNIKDGRIDLADLVFISQDKAERLKSSQVRAGDLIVSQRGTIGMPALVGNEFPAFNISANLLAIKNIRQIDPDFLQLFLASKFGTTQLERRRSGQVQDKITTSDLESIFVPSPPGQEELVQLIETARKARFTKLARADSLLSDVDSLLFSELGIRQPMSSVRSSYAARMAREDYGDPLGADYHHPERTAAIRAIRLAKRAKTVCRLGSLVEFRRKLQLNADLTRYIGLADLESNTGQLRRITDEVPSGQCFEFCEGDVLFARLRPYLNKVWVADRSGECSPEFHVMRVGTDLDPNYLAAVLRCSVVVGQTKHMMTGNTHPRLANEDVANLMIPVPPLGTQKALLKNLQARRATAHRLRKECQQEWEAAKEEFETRLVGSQ